MTANYDLIVIGGGSGGVATANREAVCLRKSPGTRLIWPML